jgi:hypothetical protein
LIVRRSHGFKGPFPSSPKILDLPPLGHFEVAKAIDSEWGTAAFFPPLTMGFS